jgi:hypothetical protein
MTAAVPGKAEILTGLGRAVELHPGRSKPSYRHQATPLL